MLRPHLRRGHRSTAQREPTRRAFWRVGEGVQTQLLKWESLGINSMLLTCQSKTTRWEKQLLLHQKQIAITSKQWGRLSWLLIRTGILTHLQVEAPECGQQRMTWHLPLRLIYPPAPHTKKNSCLAASDSQTITSFFFPEWRYVPVT